MNTLVRCCPPLVLLASALAFAPACGGDPSEGYDEAWEELEDPSSDVYAHDALEDDALDDDALDDDALDDDGERLAAEAEDDDWVTADDEEGVPDADEDGGAEDGWSLDDEELGEDAPFGAFGATSSAPDPRHRQEMTYATANIGRKYRTKAQVQRVFDRVGDVIGGKSGPKFIGWQEIGGGDPCGKTCEMEALRGRFNAERGWATRRPKGERPSGATERVQTPVTSKGANEDVTARAKYASPPWAGVSNTRFVTIVHYPTRNVSVLNTHFIAGAWSCKANRAQRRDYWRQAWRALKAAVAREHTLGRNVIVTGDLNRPRSANPCNPAWDPTSLHPRAKIVGGQGIDYIYAVPAAGQRFVVSKRPNGSKKRGSVFLGIDGHKAHWVTGRFLPRRR